MNEVRTLSIAAKLNISGLVLAAAGIGLQIVSGSELYPTVPPGPIILLVAAGLVAIGPRRWAPYVGLIVPLLLIVGASIATVVSGSFIDQLTEVTEAGIFVGTLLQLLGMIGAAAAAIAMLRVKDRAAR
ncbi:MAG: hypothetical protein ACRDH8_04515 [Actinomycetota bacterium]